MRTLDEDSPWLCRRSIASRSLLPEVYSAASAGLSVGFEAARLSIASRMSSSVNGFSRHSFSMLARNVFLAESPVMKITRFASRGSTKESAPKKSSPSISGIWRSQRIAEDRIEPRALRDEERQRGTYGRDACHIMISEEPADRATDPGLVVDDEDSKLSFVREVHGVPKKHQLRLFNH